jgi:hypothetical protein
MAICATTRVVWSRVSNQVSYPWFSLLAGASSIYCTTIKPCISELLGDTSSCEFSIAFSHRIENRLTWYIPRKEIFGRIPRKRNDLKIRPSRAVTPAAVILAGFYSIYDQVFESYCEETTDSGTHNIIQQSTGQETVSICACSLQEFRLWQ